MAGIENMKSIDKNVDITATKEMQNKAENMTTENKITIGKKLEETRPKIKREILERTPGKHIVSNHLQKGCEENKDKLVNSYLKYKRPKDPEPKSFT